MSASSKPASLSAYISTRDFAGLRILLKPTARFAELEPLKWTQVQRFQLEMVEKNSKFQYRFEDILLRRRLLLDIDPNPTVRVAGNVIAHGLFLALIAFFHLFGAVA